MFEYLRLDMNDGSHPIQWDELGRDGWELVTIYKGIAYFKRQQNAIKLGIANTPDGNIMYVNATTYKENHGHK